MKIPLYESQSAVADAQGNATVRFFPGVAGSSWKVKRITTSVNVAPSTLINLVMYRNTVSETNRVDGTESAAQDSSETDIDLQASDTLIGVYSNAPVGSNCTITLSGDKDTGRNY